MIVPIRCIALVSFQHVLHFGDVATRCCHLHRRQRQADPRWTTNKHEVLFDQKGLFQTDISVHHALLAAALQNYHSAQIATIDPHTQSRSSDSPAELRQLYSRGSCSELPGNEWGFEHMAERMAAAAKASEEEENAAESGLIIRLPELQVRSLNILTYSAVMVI